MLFERFWALNTWKERQIYITTLVTKVDIKQRKVAEERSRRHTSFAYYLKLEEGQAIKVCQALFASTFSLLARTIREWLNKDPVIPDPDEQATVSPLGPKSGPHARLETDERDFLMDWLKDLPTVDSHYCRSTESYKDKKFLLPGTTIA